MRIEVRYYSRSGNTKKIAEAIGRGVEVDAISIDSDNSMISEDVDLLFIGGALYAYGLDKKLNEYLDNLDGSKIKRAVAFSTSMISKHSVDLIKKKLVNKNIAVEEDYIYSKSKISDETIKTVELKAKDFINK